MRIRCSMVLLCAMLSGCSGSGPTNNGVYLLLDTSGTYRQELDKAEQIVNFALSRLGAFDTLAVARIDTGSFSEKDIVAKATFQDRPSEANRQKRLFSERIGEFVDQTRSSPYTDITGGMLQAIEFLNEKETSRKTIFIFSDLEEDLVDGYIRDMQLELHGFEVVALNVTKLRSDNINPNKYLDRVRHWQERVEAGGGTWRVVNDLDRLEKLLES